MAGSARSSRTCVSGIQSVQGINRETLLSAINLDGGFEQRLKPELNCYKPQCQFVPTFANMYSATCCMHANYQLDASVSPLLSPLSQENFARYYCICCLQGIPHVLAGLLTPANVLPIHTIPIARVPGAWTNH
jgi:hypothetical protein